MLNDEECDALKSLIKPSKAVRKAKAGGGKAARYELTPKGILYMAICDAYGDVIDDGAMRDMNRFDRFMSAFLQKMSEKSTSGERSDVFGKDFNQFFRLVVNAINACGKMYKVLRDNGIEFDISDMSDDDGDEEGC